MTQLLGILFALEATADIGDVDDDALDTAIESLITMTHFYHGQLRRLYAAFDLESQLEPMQDKLSFPTGHFTNGTPCCYRIHPEEVHVVDTYFGGDKNHWTHAYNWKIKCIDDRYQHVIGHQGLTRFVNDFPLFKRAIERYIQRDHQCELSGQGRRRAALLLEYAWLFPSCSFSRLDRSDYPSTTTSRGSSRPIDGNDRLQMTRDAPPPARPPLARVDNPPPSSSSSSSSSIHLLLLLHRHRRRRSSVRRGMVAVPADVLSSLTSTTTTTTTKTETDGTTIDDGEDAYVLAEEATRNAESARRDREDRTIREQIEAAITTTTTTTTIAGRRAAGIAVVRTIAERAREEWGRRGYDAASAVLPPPPAATSPSPSCPCPCPSPRSSDDDGEEEGYWRNAARERMEESAFRHGYGPALTRIGNRALELSGWGGGSDDGGDDDTSPPSSSSSYYIGGVGSGTTTPSLLLPFDKERCEKWIDVSPVSKLLATIVEIANDDDDDVSARRRLRTLAMHLYATAGERGSSGGLYNLGRLLWDEREYSRAMAAFHDAMEMGDSDAAYFVAAQYLSYEEEEEEDEEEKEEENVDDDDDDDDGGDDVHFLRRTYERYGPAFATSLRSMASTATATTTTTTTTMPSLSNDLQRHGYALLLHAAHRCGHGPALHHLALLCDRNGDADEFRRLLSSAADGGNPDSLFLRGHCRYFGTDGHDRDIPAAMEDFLAAADGGNVDAMVSAGAVLHRGVRSDDGRTIVVERDQRRAFDLYQRAGELGSVEGWRNVVSCYAHGQGVPKCMDTAKHIANMMLREDDGS
ncbi:hypothetical protein ACHAW5_003901 [Stephanodiscus triporus]|uniref:Uncharacterized protein n=1 Tax=Stephanodiscus triporus TaxID=2934178 RepID=A0ABD3MPU1_9STRA